MELSLYNIANQLILESVNRNQILDAIKKRKLIRIYYAGDPIINEGYRNIEPYAFGISKAGNPVIRAYQINGVTDTEIPDWKLFRVDRIVSWHVFPKSFYTPREKYNQDGDRSMIRVISQVKF